MKTNLRKTLSIALLSVGSLASLTGCGGSSSSYDPDNFLPNGTSENPYQIVKEPVTIKIFAPHSSGSPEYKDMKMFKYLSKVTNLNFEFTTPDTSAYSARRAAVWEDRNYKPDLFLFNNQISEQVQYAENHFDALTPFNDSTYTDSTGNVGNLIDNYMPTYKKLLDENFGISTSVENAKETAMVSDGKMYCSLSVKDVARDLTYKMFINNVWIKNIYSSYPNSYAKTHEIDDASKISTIEDYVGILTDFNSYDANNNGKTNDEIALSSKAFEYLRNFIIQSYGYVSYGCELESDGTKFTYVPKTEAYKRYLQTANSLWEAGLMDKSSPENKTDSQMATNGKRLGSFVAAAPYIITTQQEDKNNLKEDGTAYKYDEEYVTVGPLLSSYYNGPRIQLGFGYFIPDGATIPSASVYKREVARLLDIMYSDLGTQLISYGVEGEDWTWDDDAHSSWTFHVPDTWTGNQEDYRATITPNAGSASALYWSNAFVGKMSGEEISRLNRQSEIYTPYLKIPEPAKYKFTSSEYERISTIKASLDSQITYYEASFITGTLDIDNENDWNTYLSTIERFNATELVTIYNTMLARYQK